MIYVIFIISNFFPISIIQFVENYKRSAVHLRVFLSNWLNCFPFSSFSHTFYEEVTFLSKWCTCADPSSSCLNMNMMGFFFFFWVLTPRAWDGDGPFDPPSKVIYLTRIGCPLPRPSTIIPLLSEFWWWSDPNPTTHYLKKSNFSRAFSTL